MGPARSPTSIPRCAMRTGVRNRLVLLLLVFPPILVGSMSKAKAGSKPVLAVFDAEADELPRNLKSTLSDYLATRLAVSGRYEIVPRDDLKRRLLNQKKESYKLCYDEACQIEIGKELAAEQVASTQIISAGELCIFTVKIFDLRKATTSNAAAVEGKCGKAGLLKLAAQAAEKLAPRSAGGEDGSVGPLGFSAKDLTPKTRGAYAVPWKVAGVVVTQVAGDTSASDAGLREGDVITGARLYDGTKVDRVPRGELTGIAEMNLREEVQLGLTIWREGSESRVYLRSPAARDRGRALGPLGFLAATVNFQLRDRFGIPTGIDGVVVTKVKEDSPAARARLQEGDVILEAAAPVKTGYRRLSKAEILFLMDRRLGPGQQLLLRVWSKGKKTRLYVRRQNEKKREAEQPSNRVTKRRPVVVP